LSTIEYLSEKWDSSFSTQVAKNAIEANNLRNANLQSTRYVTVRCTQKSVKTKLLSLETLS